VRAAREESDKHHQVGQSKQPLFGLDTSSFCRTGDHAQMTAAREVVQVIDANARQASNFGVRKDFLARFDSNQWGLANLAVFVFVSYWFDAAVRLGDANIPSNSRSVSSAVKLLL